MDSCHLERCVTVERELADCCMPGQAAARQLVGRGEDGERNRQVESRAFLAQIGGGEVDDEAATGPVELGGLDAAANPFLCFLAGAVREADDPERRDSALQGR